MSRPESREIYQMSKINIEISSSDSVIGGKPSTIYFECSSTFELKSMLFMPCRVLSCAKYRFDNGFTFKTRALDVYDLVFVYSGSLSVNYRGAVTIARRNSVVFVHSAGSCEMTQTGGEALEILHLSLSGLSPMNYYALICKEHFSPINIYSFDVMDTLLDKIVYYMKYPTEKNSILLVDTMSGVFTELYMNAQGGSDRDTRYNHPKWFIDTIQNIEDCGLRRISIKEVAGKIGVSESHLYKIFKEYTGVSPYQYLLNLRISRAQFLLTYTDEQIKFISYSVGFNSVNHFITHFKKATGYTPAEFRKKRKTTGR